MLIVLAVTAGMIGAPAASADTVTASPTQVDMLLRGEAPYQDFFSGLVQGGDGASIADFMTAQAEAGVAPGIEAFTAEAGTYGTLDALAMAGTFYVALPIALAATVYVTYHMNWGAIYASTLGFYDSGDRYQLSSLKWVQTDDGWHWTLTAGSTDTSTGGPSLYPVPAVAPADPSGPLTGYGEAGSEADTCVMYQFPSGCLDAGSPWPVSSAVNVETNIRNYFFDYGLGTYSLLANQACWQTLDCTAFRLRAVPNQLLRAIGERAVITAVTVGTTEPTGIPGTTFDPCTFGAASQYGPCVDRTQMTPDGPQETATATIESNPTLATAISAAIDTATPSTTVLVPACNGITYDACVVLLQAAGLVGTTTRLLGDPGIAGDALYSPGFVEYTSPSPGEAVAVDVAVQVAVYANPDGTDPTTSGSGGTTTPEDTGPSCNCPSLDFTPLQVDVGGKFPFGAFTWVKGLVDQFGTSSETPSWTLTKPSGLGGGAMTVTAPANVYRDISDAVMKFIVIVSSIWFAGTWIVGWNRGDGLAD